jgi:branched-subunit amino acid transport protein AzlD
MVLVAKHSVDDLAIREDWIMNNNSHLLAIAALALTSLLVRIIPVFIKINITDTSKAVFERALPCAVFITFAVYICATEILKNAIPATAAILLTLLMVFVTRASLITTALFGSLVYIAIQFALNPAA